MCARIPLGSHFSQTIVVSAISLCAVTATFAQLSVVALTPTNTAVGVCYDTPLQITFDSTPKVTTAGEIRIYDVTNDVTPVDVVDLSLGNLQSRTFPGDAQPFNVHSVLIKGNTATIIPHAGVLTSNQSYFVNIDAGVFTDTSDVPFPGINDDTTWTFSTKVSGPNNPTNLVVAADGTGDFVTVQGAVDSVPSGNIDPTMIHVKDGDYVEIVNISGKPNLVIRGESREGTTIGYANNANIAPGGTTHARMAFKVNSDDIAIDNLTVTNRTPQGGSQAEALMIETDVKRFIANNVKIASYQDTILANTSGTQGYFNSSLIQGDVDFIWGGGNLFFTNCEVRSLRSSSAITQPRTDQGSNGMSFVECRFTRTPGVSSVLFARSFIQSPSSQYGNVSIARCLIDSHVTGWESYVESPRAALRFWEFGNSNLSATASALYNGIKIGITNNDPRLEAALSSTLWLNGWEPQLSPNIIVQPQSQYFVPGQNVQLAVLATGIPEPTYQWRRNGTNLVAETEDTLLISSSELNDVGEYSVVVSNVAGFAASVPATLTLLENPVPPTVSDVTIIGNGQFGFSLSGASGQPFRIWGSQDVTLSPIPSVWTLLSNGVFGVEPIEFIDPQSLGLNERFYSVTVP